MQSDEVIKHNATKWVQNKTNQQMLVGQFADIQTFPPTEKPIIIFMAGSPGAGKTEFVRMFTLFDKQGKFETHMNFVVVDPDEIRKYLPGYNGSNSHLFQNAVSIGVDVIFRNVLKNKQNAIVDGTFSHPNALMKMLLTL